MRRLPVYLLVDTSSSMRGESIVAANTGIQMLIAVLKQDSMALENVYMSILSFDEQIREILPLTELNTVNAPILSASSMRPMMGMALYAILQKVEQEVIKNTTERRGDWKPLLFVISNGNPDDQSHYHQIVKYVKNSKFASIIACAPGQDTREDQLRLLTDQVYSLSTMDGAFFLRLFKWISQSNPYNPYHTQEQSNLNLPPPPSEINLLLYPDDISTSNFDNARHNNSVMGTLWRVSAENIFELPKGRSFRKSFEEMILPKIICGTPYECVLKIITLNNTYEKYKLVSASIPDRNDFSVEFDQRRTMLHIKGVTQDTSDVRLQLRYAVPNARTGRIALRWMEKVLEVKPDPNVVRFKQMRTTLADALKQGIENGEVGKYFEFEIDLPTKLAKFQLQFQVLQCEIKPACGIQVRIDEHNIIHLQGTPITQGEISLTLHGELNLVSGSKPETLEFVCTMIDPDPIFKAWDDFSADWRKSIVSQEIICEEKMDLLLPLPKSFLPDRMHFERISLSDTSLSCQYNACDSSIAIYGIPSAIPDRPIAMAVDVSLDTRPVGCVVKHLDFETILLTKPNPKWLWMSKPTNPADPYKIKNEENLFLNAGTWNIVAASKRGRLNAHDGYFRDNNFKIDYINETEWIIIAVSDGNASAKYSREGSMIACQVFWHTMREMLASTVVNTKLDTLEQLKREYALRNAVLYAALQGQKEIATEALRVNACPRDYDTTLLGLVMKRYYSSWLIVTVGIGNGVVGLLEPDGVLNLLTTPDMGKFFGQTKYITMETVWKNDPFARTHVKNVSSSAVIMLMTDGVSDPKFGSNRNLRNPQLWKELWTDIRSHIPVDNPSDTTAKKLGEWLDFWTKGCHDDRTIALLF